MQPGSLARGTRTRQAVRPRGLAGAKSPCHSHARRRGVVDIYIPAPGTTSLARTALLCLWNISSLLYIYYAAYAGRANRRGVGYGAYAIRGAMSIDRVTVFIVDRGSFGSCSNEELETSFRNLYA